MIYAEVFQKLLAHCKEHGFIFPSSEIYDGLSGIYDYGPLGVEMKRAIVELWWKSMTQIHDNIVGIDAAILMAPKVWKASGHVDAFNDPLIDNKVSKKRYRADTLIEDFIDKLVQKNLKEAEKKAQKEGWELNGPQYSAFLANSRNGVKAAEVTQRLADAMNAGDMQAMKAIIIDCEIADPESGSRDWTDVRQFNLMFSTELGSVADDSQQIYLRPETAQGIFVNFLNVQKTSRNKIPFGIAQVGKAFRNEIIARQFIFRMREFEQMEMQFFVKPGTQAEWFEYWKEMRYKWHINMGVDPARLRFKVHDKLAHYADAAVDIEFEYPFGFKETEGIHSRTDFDLRQHQQFSGKKLQYFDPESQESYTPYVVETSVGLDRTFLLQLCNGYAEEDAPTASGGVETRVVLKLNPYIAPIQIAILPLVKKDGFPELADGIYSELKHDFRLDIDDKDAIGRRYRRQDAKGTPFCVTIDQQTKEDDSVTVRDRDTMEQVRVNRTQLGSYFFDKLRVGNFLRKLV
jgi:glycyl-tRNA synthetase